MMRIIGSGGTALLILLATAACEGHGSAYPTDPDSPQLVVHGVLVAGQDEQEILVEHTRALSAGFYRGLTPAVGAQVEVEHEGTVHVFAPFAGEPGVFRARLLPQPGGVYTLRVTDPAAGVVTAVTTMPWAPVLLTPSRDTVVARNSSLTAHWRSAQGAAAYVLVLADPVTGRASATSTVTDTTGVSALGSGSRRFAVASVDANLLSYRFVIGEDERLVPARSSVEGGFGVFGALAHSQRPLVEVAP